MGRRMYLGRHWRRLWRRHGQTIGISLVVLTVMAATAFLMWLMSGVHPHSQ